MSQHKTAKQSRKQKPVRKNTYTNFLLLLSDRHSSSAWLNANRKFMLLLSCVLGLEQFRKLFEQIINKHSGGDKTITHWKLDTQKAHAHTLTYSCQTRHDTTQLVYNSHSFAYAYAYTHRTHNISAYVMPELACWSAELSAYFVVFSILRVCVCRRSRCLRLWSDQANSWINKQSFSIYMTNRFRFWLTSAHWNKLEFKCRKHAR